MKFGSVPINEAVGALAAHTVSAGGFVLKKGSLVSEAHVESLKAAGVISIVVARLEADDVGEDEAASRVAQAVAGKHVEVFQPFTGRSNLHAGRSGVLVIDKEAIDRLNNVDEAITVATLPAYKPVVEGEMIGTVKIIPYAVPRHLLDQALHVAAQPAISVAPYMRRNVGVICTLSPMLKPSIVTKTLDVLARRLAAAEASICSETRIPHDTVALQSEIARLAAGPADLIIVFGASAIADRRDVIPAALTAAGGQVEHFGMPVDPGNLLMVGSIGGKPVLGAPGCARSPKENGFDWVLHRCLADIPVRRQDITSLGVGGLLMEIVSRPQPRAGGHSEEE